MNVPDAPDGGAQRDKDLPIRLCIINNQTTAPMAPTDYLTHTFRSLQQLQQQQRQHHQNLMPPAVLVMIFVLWCSDRQAVTVLNK